MERKIQLGQILLTLTHNLGVPTSQGKFQTKKGYVVKSWWFNTEGEVEVSKVLSL